MKWPSHAHGFSSPDHFALAKKRHAVSCVEAYGLGYPLKAEAFPVTTGCPLQETCPWSCTQLHSFQTHVAHRWHSRLRVQARVHCCHRHCVGRMTDVAARPLTAAEEGLHQSPHRQRLSPRLRLACAYTRQQACSSDHNRQKSSIGRATGKHVRAEVDRQ